MYMYIFLYRHVSKNWVPPKALISHHEFCLNCSLGYPPSNWIRQPSHQFLYPSSLDFDPKFVGQLPMTRQSWEWGCLGCRRPARGCPHTIPVPSSESFDFDWNCHCILPNRHELKLIIWIAEIAHNRLTQPSSTELTKFPACAVPPL